MVNRELITKEIILRKKHGGRRRTRVTVFEILSHIKGEHLTQYFEQYGEILNVSPDRKYDEWFDIRLPPFPTVWLLGPDYSSDSRYVGSAARLVTRPFLVRKQGLWDFGPC